VNNKFCFVLGRKEKKYKQSFFVEVDNIFAICNMNGYFYPPGEYKSIQRETPNCEIVDSV
jgi:hypothetical protein